MNEDIEKKLSAEFPVEFLTIYGPRFYPIVAVLGEMSAKGEVENVYHAANLFRLMVGAAESVAIEARKKAAAEWSPRWVM